jgi:hypothetical protein
VTPPQLNPAAASLTPLRDLMQTVVDRIAALRLPDAPLEPAFPVVRLFDLRQLPDAFAEGVATGDRFALVFIDREAWTSRREGRFLDAVRRVRFSVLAVDTEAADRQAATARTLLLHDLLHNLLQHPLQPPGAVAGPNAGILGWLDPHTFIQPLYGEPFVLKRDARRELPGRAGWISLFEAVGGRIRCDLGPLPIT